MPLPYGRSTRHHPANGNTPRIISRITDRPFEFGSRVGVAVGVRDWQGDLDLVGGGECVGSAMVEFVPGGAVR